MSWFRVVPDKSGAVTIGRYKEQLVREVAFPLPPLGEGGRYQANFQRPHAEAPYPLASRVEGQTLIWLVSLADTSDPGEGLVEIRWDGPNGETWKSPQYAVRIAKGLADPKEAPEAWAGFMQQVNRDAGRAESAADNAAKALEKLEDGIASGDFRGEKGEKGDPGPQGPKGEAGPAGDTTAADAAAEAAKTAAQEAQKAAESVGGLADDLATTQKDLAKAQRAIKLQAKLTQGQVWDFEEDAQTAYQRIVPSGAKAGAVMELGGQTRRGKNVIPLVLSANEQNTFATVTGATIHVKNTSKNNCYPQTEWFELPAGTYCAVQSDANVETYLQLNEGDYSHTLKGLGYIVFTLDAATPVRYMLSVRAGINFSMAIQTVRGSTPDYGFEPYTPELVSALVDEVRVMGKNLVNIDAAVIQGGSNVSIAGNDIIIKADSSVKIPLTLAVGDVVSVSFGVAADFSNAEVHFLLGNGKKIILWGVYTGAVGDSKKTISRTISENVVAICMQSWNKARNVKFSDLQVELFATPTAYSPYRLETYPIPDAVRSLPGYGWSAGNVANTVERTEDGWQYVQRVGSVDLGTFDWYDGGTATSARRMNSRTKLDNAKIPIASSDTPNVICKTYNRVSPDQTWLCTKEGVTINAKDGIVIVYDSQYATAESTVAFKQHVQGLMLFYELATPITTDITDLMGDALAPFAVEAGGSITLHHPKADEGFAIDVPANIQYITKLSEVSANG